MDRARIDSLMDQASTGDRAAFGALCDAVQDEILRLALALGQRRDDAVEATQETLLRAFSRRATWRPGSDALAWLCGIAVNVVREQQRRDRRNTAWLKETLQNATPGSAASGQMGPQNLEPDELQNLAQAIDQLPPRQREAIACRFLRRMSIRETADLMGCAEGTVKSAVAAGLERLQAIVECSHESR